MADMKMRKQPGGYLLRLTDGQLKKWAHLKREMHVQGTINNKGWENTAYTLKVDDDVYTVSVEANRRDKTYKVNITRNGTNQSFERTYRTYECNDCVMRMLMELHNGVLATKANQTPNTQAQ